MKNNREKMRAIIGLKHSLVLLVALGLGIKVHGQAPTIRQDLLSFPVSPEAGKLGTFGKVPVNLFFGQLNKSLDLFQGTEGDFSVPVKMSYSYSGCRVEDSPSIAGLGWQLSLGGVVTREVRGLPDEHPNGYYRNAVVIGALNTYFTSGTMTLTNGKKFMEGEYDPEADVYMVGVNGISFSFKIASNGNPVFMSKHNYKVDIIRPSNPTCVADISGFTVTDTNGNKYNFNTKETNESVGDDQVFNDSFPNYTSSWQLSNIALSNGASIVYGYADDNFDSYSYFATGVYRGLTGNGTTLYDAGVKKTVIKRKILTSITANAFKVALTVATFNNQKVYSQLTVKNVKDELMHTYDFTYAGVRNLLKRIDYNGQFFYGFDYHNETNMPAFITSVQQFPKYLDEWGYYNGANNTYLLNIPATQYEANKEPSFNHTLAGALYKIKYPTGGSTEVYYEQNETYSLESENTDPNIRLHLAFKSDNVSTAPEVKTQIFTKTFATDVVAIMDQRMETNNGGPIQFTITPTAGCQTSVNYYQQIAIDRAYGVETPNVCLKLFALLNDGCTQGNCVETRSSNGKFIIRAGTYEFKFIAEQNRYANKLVKAMVNIDFYDPAIADSLGINYSIKKIGGIRVVKTIDNPLIGIPVTTNFEYGSAGQFSTLVNKISYRWEHGTPGPGTGLGTVESWNATEYNARSFNPLSLSGTPAFNGQVKTYTHKQEVITPKKLLCTSCSGGFSNYDGQVYYSYLGGVYGTKKVTYGEGFVLNSFEGPRRYPSNTYPFVPTGQDKSIGTPKKTQVYAPTAVDGTERLLTDESNMYMYSNTSNWATVYNNPDFPKSLKMGYKIKRTGLTHDYSYHTVNTFYLLNTYDKDIDSESYLSNTDSKEYLTDIPVENSKAYTYDSYLQPKKTTTSGSDGSSIAIENFYPYDFTDGVFPTMVTKNCISPVVQVVTKKDDVVTETLKYDYTNVSGSLFKPYTYLKSKGAAALESLVRYGYDNSGNLTMQKKILNLPDSNGDANVMIIWGYKKTLPLVKFENPGGVLIPPATVTTLQGLSDTGTENDLLAALQSFRDSFPTALITTYTHKPLVGVSTITDPTGQTLYYNYDTQGRLLNVKEKDASGNMNILSENMYRYKTQN